jgi:hypothetical protein
LKKMADPINVKVYVFVQRSWSIYRWCRKLKFSRLIDGPPKPKGKIWSPENFAPWDPKWWLKNAMFFNILVPKARRET